MKLIRRIAVSLVLIFVVSSITFFLVRLMPGNPYSVMYHKLVMQGMTPLQAEDQVKGIMNAMPNEPVFVQYIQWLTQLVHGNLGTSIEETGVPVTELIFNALPWTLVTVSIGLFVSFLIGIVLGVISASRRDTWVSSVIDNVGSIAHAIPVYVTAVALLYLFNVVWHVFPSSGAYGIMETPGLNWPFLASFAYHIVLPEGTYILAGFGSWELAMKSTTIMVMNDDFMMAARIRGLTRQRIMNYLGWNSILPLFTLFMLSLGTMFGGSVFIESTYAFPGIGNLLATAVTTRDYPVMEGCFMLTTATIIFANVLADFLYAVLDPRITM
ncbi:MAG: ABC transporter permease [Firmicutes bacterium]|nr:ABC transporter permease [Bacillota bacterium]